MSVKIIAIPCSSAAAITSSSRIEPPGWITQVMPTAAAGIDTVTEREEGVRGHGGTFHFQPFITCFDSGDFRRVDAAHLACAYSDGHVLFGVDDGVGLDELRHFPAEQRVAQLLLARLAFGHYAQVSFCAPYPDRDPEPAGRRSRV